MSTNSPSLQRVTIKLPKGFVASRHTAKLSEPAAFVDGQEHVMALRRRDGGVSGPHAVMPGNDAQQVVFADLPDIPIETGLSAERTHFAFGIAEQWSLLARVIAVRPRGEQVEITCVAEHSGVHSADGSVDSSTAPI